MGKLGDMWKKATGEVEPVRAAPPPVADARPPRSMVFTSGNFPLGATTDDQRRRLESYGLSHVGKVREGNEDHFVIASLQRSLEVRQTNLEDRAVLDPLCGPKAKGAFVREDDGSLDWALDTERIGEAAFNCLQAAITVSGLPRESLIVDFAPPAEGY